MTTDRDHPMLIDGRLCAAADGRWLISENPADEQPLGRVPLAGAADVDHAVRAAARAQPGWNDLAVGERATLLRELGRRLQARAQEILSLEVRDTGNTIGKMSGDLGAAVGLLDYYAGLGLEIKGETIPATARGLHLTLREPFGVVGRIVPFNHPIYFAVGAIAGPLMAGNTVVVKTPEQSPLSASILGEVCRDVLPPGAVNIVSGTGPEAGDALVRHPLVRRIAFTGSVPTGLAIQRAAAEVCVKHVSLELGGKNPMIVFPDVDPDRAAAVAVAGMNFAWQGQSCGSTSRLMLHDSIHDAVLERVAARVAAIRLGDPLDPASEMGPVNSRRHHERILDFIASGRDEGAMLVHGGRRPQAAAFSRGHWVEPTVFAGVRMDMRIARQEIFGPVLSVLRWREVDEVVAMANASEYGLAAAVWTADLGAALRVGRQIDCGYVWINTTPTHYKGTPFGGTRNSGIGREECLEELLSYTQTKALHIGLS